MSYNREQAVFLQHVAELIRKAPEYGFLLTAGELYRTPEQQALHIKNGRSKTMNSRHLDRMAIDLNFFEIGPDNTLKLVYDGDGVRRLGAFWESLDPANRWGGNWSSFKDTPHFERGKTSGSASPQAMAGILPPPAAGGCGSKLLMDPVGTKCRNLTHDVKSIQKLLNLNINRLSPLAPLKCDGIIGQKTIGAVLAFQKKVLSMAEPDGTVRPGDKTLLELCSVLPGGFNEAVLGILYLNAADEAVNSFVSVIAETMAKYTINTPLRQAHFLAQIGHESGELRFREELASGEAYENRRDLGNIEPGDGPRYKGRGLIQLTGRANYAEYDLTGGFKRDIEADPGQVATDDGLCVDVAGWYWDRKGLNALADRDDLEAVTRRINGGLNGLDDRRRLLLRAKTLLPA
jgi:predicted chitinase